MASSGVQVFVQLGSLPRYAFHYAAQAALMMPGYDTVIITDRKVKTPPAGLRIVALSSVVSPSEIVHLDEALIRGGFDLSYRRGYWRWVFLRFLCVRNFLLAGSFEGPAVHLESDVASFVTPKIVVGVLATAGDVAAVPMHDTVSACPSMLIAPSAEILAQAMGIVADGAGTGAVHTDMKLLGDAVHSGLLATLPTRPSESRQVLDVSRCLEDGSLGHTQEARVIFDAAGVGQYLFGIDPRNNAGVLIPGYREERRGIDPGLWTDWHLVTCSDGVVRVAVRDGDLLAVLAALHIHAKTSIPLPALGPRSWSDWLAIANHERGATAVVLPRVYARTSADRARLAALRRFRSLVTRLNRPSGSNPNQT